MDWMMNVCVRYQEAAGPSRSGYRQEGRVGGCQACGVAQWMRVLFFCQVQLLHFVIFILSYI